MLTSAEKIEQQILHPAAYKISDIKVLKAWGQIPKNNQIGPTCGIYALDAAMQIQGRDIAPRKKESHRPYSAPGEVSLLKGAKLEGLTKVGEIGRAQDLATLAACFGVGVRIERFGSEGELWSIILRAVAGNHALVLPYSCT